MIVYDFTIPYSGDGSLTIINNGKTACELDGLHFSTNLVAGAPYGGLFPPQAKITSSQRDDGSFDYVLTLAKSLPISPGQTLTLNLPYTQVVGVLPIAMDPESVHLIKAGTATPLPMQGQCTGNECNDPVPNHAMRGYFANWDIYQRKFTVKDMPVRKINEILYAFINYDTNGNLALFDPNSDDKMLVELSKMRRKYPYLNTKLSIGGWTLSADFSAMAANPTSRANFVKQVVSAIQQLNMNGVDIDWEYPILRQGSPGDGKHYADLLCDLTSALDNLSKQTGEDYSVSIAAPGGVDKIEAITKDDPTAWSRIVKCKTQINIMSYDYHGAFDSIADNQSPVNTDRRDPNAQSKIGKDYALEPTLQAYLKVGANPAQISVGIPLYGRAMQANTQDNYGLWQPITGSPPGQYNDKTGMYDAKCALYSDCGSGSGLPNLQFLPAITHPLTNETQVPWGYNSNNEVISLDDVTSTANKAQKVLDLELGGMMFWTPSGDANNTEQSLISAAQSKLISADVNPQIALAAVLMHTARNVSAGIMSLIKSAFSKHTQQKTDQRSSIKLNLERLNKLKTVVKTDCPHLLPQWHDSITKLNQSAIGKMNTNQTMMTLSSSKQLIHRIHQHATLTKENHFRYCLFNTKHHDNNRLYKSSMDCITRLADTEPVINVLPV